jgi:hypothetical protein
VFKIRYASTHRRDVVTGRFIRSTVTVFVKVPYSGLFGLVDWFARAMFTNQVTAFSIDVARPDEITDEVRTNLRRWTDALVDTSLITQVDWTQ